ncbi:MAG: RnfABCDGE type electron transport complex subunit G [Deltaproteobacteria bacterium]|nr:RnfABCDGE type electron transport complex subunit G [Deltaproteobacteria bacterium]MBW1929675.1 RnfABCDGE type electron transport complex subunit G [Deltaproteobacteria bacterium]MBW2025262.1 RnfABCDGE type electron transport complex subunit G [Deltaproteobacteria bacterium]MBW2125166.1 RnfABCDGE type electron transport complex subunit G [Deltaproteobacteria bacterium]RLB24857.1 MAG: electron transporter RnfG [Deltaproteobacteria bacterium]
MRELFRMVFVLTAICAISALVLAYANKATRAAREYQLLKYVEEPSIREVLKGYDNDPIKDRVEMFIGRDNKGKPIRETIFPAKKNGKLIGMAYSTEGHGYHGTIEVMVGVDMNGTITGISIMQHSETPGLGARVVEPKFRDQFKGLKLSGDLNLSTEGGKIDGVSGATYSSKGVVSAVRKALELFPRAKKEVS